MKRDKHTTKVIFRVFPEGDVVAIFPEIPAQTQSYYACASYCNNGGHGAADPSIVYSTRLATPSEYRETARILRVNYGYRLKVYRRINRKMTETRRQEWERMRDVDARGTISHSA